MEVGGTGGTWSQYTLVGHVVGLTRSRRRNGVHSPMLLVGVERWLRQLGGRLVPKAALASDTLKCHVPVDHGHRTRSQPSPQDPPSPNCRPPLLRWFCKGVGCMVAGVGGLWAGVQCCRQSWFKNHTIAAASLLSRPPRRPHKFSPLKRYYRGFFQGTR